MPVEIVSQSNSSVISQSDSSREIQEIYTYFFQEKIGDGPKQSLESLVSRARPTLENLHPEDWVVDLGSAQGTFFREYRKTQFHLAQLDFAHFGSQDLVHGMNLHMKASGAVLPIKSESVAVVVSNLAFDFFFPRKTALEELYRVIAPGGFAFLNLNTRKLMLPDDLDQQMARINRKIFQKMEHGGHPRKSDLMERRALKCKQVLRTNHTFYENNEELDILMSFISHGFQVRKLQVCSNNDGRSWWEVDLQK